MRNFLRDELGQDFVEYSLLLAFICLSGAALYIGLGRNLSTLWTIANNRLASANTGGS
jgi:Flp pilus assembly pilin Flp